MTTITAAESVCIMALQTLLVSYMQPSLGSSFQIIFLLLEGKLVSSE